ncbi:response regulator [Spirosoma koreense]
MNKDVPFEILVIDDDQPTVDLLERVAQQNFPQANFMHISSPEQTMAYLGSGEVDWPRLILLDIDFKQPMDGLALLPQLRTHFKGQVPIIMFSVSAEDDQVQEAYDTGAVAYTRKPDSLESWREYVQLLKAYWHETILLPPPPLPPIDMLKRN